MSGRLLRRMGLAAAGLAAAGLVFVMFRLWSPSVSIPSESEFSVPAPVLPYRVAPEGGAFADTAVELVENSRWVRRDPQTKQVIEIGGFSRLLTPPEGSAYWIVESPYLIRYEDRFVCRIDARRGRIQMEAGGQVPSNVELSEQVTLQIRRPEAKEEGESLTRIFLDNLIYNSERSEFFTEGPVNMVSEEAELKGTGLVLIYNPRLSRMEYLEVRDLDYLLLKNAAGIGPQRSVEKSSGRKNGALRENPLDLSAKPETSKSPGEPELPDPLYYQCSLRNHVVIHYGSRLVVAGADQVHIRQILWQRNSKPVASELPERAVPMETDSSRKAPSTGLKPSSGPLEGPKEDLPAVRDNEVLITCEGGIVIQVASEAEQGEEQPRVSAVEMIGQLQIDRIAEDSNARIPLAVCSALRYVLSEDVLELFSGTEQNPVWLYLDRAGGRIRTKGNVFWDRKSNLARIDGPGQVFWGEDAPEEKGGRKQVLFQGPMDLEFAQVSSDLPLSVKTANLAGGVEAVLEDEGIHSRSEEALFRFQPNTNKPQVLDLAGDVRFVTSSDGRPSQVEADKTVFHFDSSGQVKTANLTGQVRLVSADQTVETESAEIEFEKTQEGRLVPAQVSLEGPSKIRSTAGEHLPPARFEALQIDYDFLKGTATAAGPVFFAFYTPPDASLSFGADPIPVEITAEDSAEFFTDGKGTMERIVFRGKVTAQWKAQSEREQMIRRFFGERLVVELDHHSEGGQRIRHISMQDQQVLFESLHFVDRKKVNHLRLTCGQFDYWGDENKLTAVGPGKMELNNQQTPASGDTGGGPISLQRPCFAYMEGFDRLSWHLSANEVRGEGAEGMYLNYWPFENGHLSDQIIVQCVRVQAGFSDQGSGKSELNFLRADGGVEYREQKQGGRYLQGDTLTYEKQDGWVVIEGSPERPCKVNGVNVPMIQYHPQTGQMKTKLSPSPSSLSPSEIRQ